MDEQTTEDHLLLTTVPGFHALSPLCVQQLASRSVLDHLSPGILLFRRGERACMWYVIIDGVVDIYRNQKVVASLVNGAVFGESLDAIVEHSCSGVVANFTKLMCITLRDFYPIWKDFSSELAPIITLIHNIIDSTMAGPGAHDCFLGPHDLIAGSHADFMPSSSCEDIQDFHGYLNMMSVRDALRPESLTPDQRSLQEDVDEEGVLQLANAQTIHDKLVACSHVLRCVLMHRGGIISDRDGYCRCMVGTQMVDWVIHNRHPTPSRLQVVGMWQTLLEVGLLNHVSHEYAFMDKYLFFRWAEDEGIAESLTELQVQLAEQELDQALTLLACAGPDALFRMVLHKPPCERSPDELEVVFEELVHVKALSHLSTMVKRELASTIMLEQQSHAGTVLFSQGDEGKSWFIIFKGSVNVSIYGKGIVCTLHEGDDFGKLALIDDAPRAATIALNQDNCQFLRVDKHDFNRILRDVEANTVRLKEHGVDVLILEKIPVKIQEVDTHCSPPVAQKHRYSVMAGTPEKMLEYLLETRIDSQRDERVADTFVDDFFLTHLMFMPTNLLCHCLSVYYHQGCSVTTFEDLVSQDEKPVAQMLQCKKRVISLVSLWVSSTSANLFLDPVANAFIEELYCAVIKDSKSTGGLHCQVQCMHVLMEHRDKVMQSCARRPVTVSHMGQSTGQLSSGMTAMPSDCAVISVNSVERLTYDCKVRLDTPAATIAKKAAQKLAMGSGHGVQLVEVKSGGERLVMHHATTSVATTLSPNGRLFVVFEDQVESLVPLCSQDMPPMLDEWGVDQLAAGELAVNMAVHHWHLMVATCESELVIHIVGRHRFPNRVCTNLDLLIYRFNCVQYWTATQVLLCSNLQKRVNAIKKLIKVAVHAKTYQDLLTFFAIVLGLSNVSVSRLHLTWEKIPSKMRKLFREFEGLLDPSRNHKSYRVLVQDMKPPFVPFIPLVIKDLTFSHEGNKTHFDGLVNFEKMHMMAQSLRNFRECKSKPLRMDSNYMKHYHRVQARIRNLRVIDNQRRLMNISYELEPPGTKRT